MQRKPPDSLEVKKALAMSLQNKNSLCYTECGLSVNKKQKEVSPMDDNHTLSHTTWNCKYHIVFAPKYRKKYFIVTIIRNKTNIERIM